MKLVLLILLGILALNALVILGVACILLLDHFRAKRRAAAQDEDAHANAS
jgi:hypothetical protein